MRPTCEYQIRQRVRPVAPSPAEPDKPLFAITDVRTLMKDCERAIYQRMKRTWKGVGG